MSRQTLYQSLPPGTPTDCFDLPAGPATSLVVLLDLLVGPVAEQLLQVQYRLTDRDLTLLGWLADHAVLTTDQIANALFPSLDFAQRRLLKLLQAGVVDRFRPHRPEGGTQPYHYLLAQLGVDVVAAQSGHNTQDPDDERLHGTELPRRDHARRRRWWLTNRANLPHLLAVNQFFTDLAGHARTHPDHALERWWPASRCMTRGSFLYLTRSHSMSGFDAIVRADGHGIWAHHDAADGITTRVPFFAEIDLGTEDLGRLVAKNLAYEAFARASYCTWPVLYWLGTSTRERHLHRRLADSHWTVPIATATREHASLTGHGPAGPVWQLHHHNRAAAAPLADGRLSLIELATTVRSSLTRQEENGI